MKLQRLDIGPAHPMAAWACWQAVFTEFDVYLLNQVTSLRLTL